jgi:hypothetical protein
MLNSARQGLSYAAMLVMLAASVAAADNAPANGNGNGNGNDTNSGTAGWQKGQPRRVQANLRQAKQKLP